MVATPTAVLPADVAAHGTLAESRHRPGVIACGGGRAKSEHSSGHDRNDGTLRLCAGIAAHACVCMRVQAERGAESGLTSRKRALGCVQRDRHSREGHYVGGEGKQSTALTAIAPAARVPIVSVGVVLRIIPGVARPRHAVARGAAKAEPLRLGL